jgi:serine/threonine protein kinase
VGPYRIERWLGSGGMGAVYEALDERYGGRVALKTIPDVSDETRLRALKREFRLMSELLHPNLYPRRETTDTRPRSMAHHRK